MKKILIVNDNPMELNMLAEMFKIKGFDISTAHQSQEALKMLDLGFRPDLLLMDFVMPGMDGIDLSIRIRQQLNMPHLPVILFSSFTKSILKQEVAKHPSMIFVEKPFNFEDLARIVSSSFLNQE